MEMASGIPVEFGWQLMLFPVYGWLVIEEPPILGHGSMRPTTIVTGVGKQRS